MFNDNETDIQYSNNEQIREEANQALELIRTTLHSREVNQIVNRYFKDYCTPEVRNIFGEQDCEPGTIRDFCISMLNDAVTAHEEFEQKERQIQLPDFLQHYVGGGTAGTGSNLRYYLKVPRPVGSDIPYARVIDKLRTNTFIKNTIFTFLTWASKYLGLTKVRASLLAREPNMFRYTMDAEDIRYLIDRYPFISDVPPVGVHIVLMDDINKLLRSGQYLRISDEELGGFLVSHSTILKINKQITRSFIPPVDGPIMQESHISSTIELPVGCAIQFSDNAESNDGLNNEEAENQSTVSTTDEASSSNTVQDSEHCNTKQGTDSVEDGRCKGDKYPIIICDEKGNLHMENSVLREHRSHDQDETDKTVMVITEECDPPWKPKCRDAADNNGNDQEKRTEDGMWKSFANNSKFNASPEVTKSLKLGEIDNGVKSQNNFENRKRRNLHAHDDESFTTKEKIGRYPEFDTRSIPTSNSTKQVPELESDNENAVIVKKAADGTLTYIYPPISTAIGLSVIQYAGSSKSSMGEDQVKVPIARSSQNHIFCPTEARDNEISENEKLQMKPQNVYSNLPDLDREPTCSDREVGEQDIYSSEGDFMVDGVNHLQYSETEEEDLFDSASVESEDDVNHGEDDTDESDNNMNEEYTNDIYPRRLIIVNQIIGVNRNEIEPHVHIHVERDIPTADSFIDNMIYQMLNEGDIISINECTTDDPDYDLMSHTVNDEFDLMSHSVNDEYDRFSETIEPEELEDDENVEMSCLEIDPAIGVTVEYVQDIDEASVTDADGNMKGSYRVTDSTFVHYDVDVLYEEDIETTETRMEYEELENSDASSENSDLSSENSDFDHIDDDDSEINHFTIFQQSNEPRMEYEELENSDASSENSDFDHIDDDDSEINHFSIFQQSNEPRMEYEELENSGASSEDSDFDLIDDDNSEINHFTIFQQSNEPRMEYEELENSDASSENSDFDHIDDDDSEINHFPLFQQSNEPMPNTENEINKSCDDMHYVENNSSVGGTEDMKIELDHMPISGYRDPANSISTILYANRDGTISAPKIQFGSKECTPNYSWSSTKPTDDHELLTPVENLIDVKTPIDGVVDIQDSSVGKC